VTLTTVAVSIMLHGISVTPLMTFMRRGKRGTSAAEAQNTSCLDREAEAATRESEPGSTLALRPYHRSPVYSVKVVSQHVDQGILWVNCWANRSLLWII